MTSNWASTFSGDISNIQFLPQNVSAYFKKPSKVVKPSSRNHSPRNKVKRRMTTHLPTRTRSIAEEQRPIFDARQGLHLNTTSARPISWHPTVPQDVQQSVDYPFSHTTHNTSVNTAFAHGLITPNAFPQQEPWLLNCPDEPLEQMRGQDYMYEANNQFTTDFQQHEMYGDHYYHTPLSAPLGDPVAYSVQNMTWPLPSSITNDVTTAPASPDFLPMPNFGEPFAANSPDQNEAKDDLVALGLYDSPAEIQSSNLLFSGSLPVRRKSLKLEESFEPKSPSDADDEDDDAESEPEPENYVTERPPPQTPLDLFESTPIPESVAQYYSYVQSQPFYVSDPGGPGHAADTTAYGFF